MRNIVLLLSAFFFIFGAHAQKNYPIFTLEDVNLVCLKYDEPVMFAIESSEEKEQLIQIDLETGSIVKRFKSRLPKNIHAISICNNTGIIYFVTTRKHEETGEKILNSIYSFSPLKDKTDLLYKENGEIQASGSVSIIDNLIVFTGRVFSEQPKIFNTRTKQFEIFSENEDLRMLCTAPAHNAFVVMNISEVDGDSVAIYVMNIDRSISEKVGIFNSSLRISSEKEENSLPGFNIINQAYDWIIDAYNTSGFPLSGFAIATRAELAMKYNQTANLFEIKALIAANNTYMVAKGRDKIFVYNTNKPVYDKPKTVSNIDLGLINEYFNSKISFKKDQLISPALQQVFNARFYVITEQEKNDSYTSESSFTLIDTNGNIGLLKDKNQLFKLLNPDFYLQNDKQAEVFQEALNELYVPGTFEKKHIAFYTEANKWIFIRDKSFGEKKGFVVEVTGQGRIRKIEYKSKIE